MTTDQTETVEGDDKEMLTGDDIVGLIEAAFMTGQELVIMDATLTSTSEPIEVLGVKIDVESVPGVSIIPLAILITGEQAASVISPDTKYNMRTGVYDPEDGSIRDVEEVQKGELDGKETG